jgi:hypothetical protein
MDWTKASGDTMVCEGCDLSLRDVVKVIALQDASSVEEVITIAGICSEEASDECRKNIEEILDIYVPIYAALKEGSCGCGGGCSGCSGCC